jgi:hypothetical protein
VGFGLLCILRTRAEVIAYMCRRVRLQWVKVSCLVSIAGRREMFAPVDA